MVRLQTLLFVSAAALVLAGPVLANEDLLAVPEGAADIGVHTQSPDIMFSEPAVAAGDEAPAQSAPKDCIGRDGVAHEPADFLPVFYSAHSSSVSLTAEAVAADQVQGGIVLDGVTYRLQKIEIPRYPAIPISSEQYKMEVRFVHTAPDGSTAILSVPVREGKANLSLSPFIGEHSAAMIDPNGLLPESREYALVGESHGADCSAQQRVQHLLLIRAVEVSASQLEAFERQFDDAM